MKSLEALSYRAAAGAAASASSLSWSRKEERSGTVLETEGSAEIIGAVATTLAGCTHCDP
jgi:hypothetical protein